MPTCAMNSERMRMMVNVTCSRSQAGRGLLRRWRHFAISSTRVFNFTWVRRWSGATQLTVRVTACWLCGTLPT